VRARTDGLAPVVLAEAARLSGDGPLHVVVLHGGQRPRWAGRLVDQGAAVTLVAADVPVDERHLRLTAEPQFDLVVDAVPRPKGRSLRFVDSFYQLRAGGVYVGRGGGADLGPEPRRVGALLVRATATLGKPSPKRAPGVPHHLFEDHALGRAVESSRVERGHLVVVNGQGDALPKLREWQLDELVSRRPELPVRTLRVIEAESFASRCAFREVGSKPGPRPPTEYDAPAVPLREYRDALVLPGQIVGVDRFLTPDTFRHHLQKRLRNRHLDDQAAHFARLHDHTADPVPLAGSYYHLDNEERGHYGHLMTEGLSRLWGWEESKAADPDLKVLLGTNRRREVQPYEYTIYAAAGISPEDIVLVDGPVRVQRLVTPAPLLSNPMFVHPRIRETWRRVGDRLEEEATAGPRPDRFFCSRRLSKRSCLNTAEVEDLFRDAGFEVVFPEDHPIGDQVAMFRSAEVIAGFAGSGLFNLCFVDRPVRVITLRSESYTAHNEHLMAALLGHTIDSVVSAPEKPGQFQSPFTFDLDHEGRDLAKILAGLPT
jgi:capsular polysaccharide biosynthesis protein